MQKTCQTPVRDMTPAQFETWRESPRNLYVRKAKKGSHKECWKGLLRPARPARRPASPWSQRRGRKSERERFVFSCSLWIDRHTVGVYDFSGKGLARQQGTGVAQQSKLSNKQPFFLHKTFRGPKVGLYTRQCSEKKGLLLLTSGFSQNDIKVTVWVIWRKRFREAILWFQIEEDSTVRRRGNDNYESHLSKRVKKRLFSFQVVKKQFSKN